VRNLKPVKETRAVGALLAAVIAAALIAACGGSSSNARFAHTSSIASGSSIAHTNSTGGSVAHTNTTTTAHNTTKSTPSPSPLGFATCMRAHGVPNFPDPTALPARHSSGQPELAPASSGGFTANPNSPAYETASNDCRSLAHATPVSQVGDQLMASQLKFAVCMRAHGVPNFPDPTNTGEFGNNGAISGVNTNSPALQNAQKTCSKFLTPRSGPPGGGPPAPPGNG